MTAGLQVFNADGTLQFDTTNRLFRTLTSVETGTVNGSITVASDRGGTVAVAATPAAGSGSVPKVTVSGGTVSWNFTHAQRTNTHLTLMVY